MKFQHTSLSPPDRSRNPLATRQQRAGPQDHGTLNKMTRTTDPKKALASLPGRCHLHAYQVFKDQHHLDRSQRRQKNNLVKRQVMPDEQESIIVPG